MIADNFVLSKMKRKKKKKNPAGLSLYIKRGCVRVLMPVKGEGNCTSKRVWQPLSITNIKGRPELDSSMRGKITQRRVLYKTNHPQDGSQVTYHLSYLINLFGSAACPGAREEGGAERESTKGQ